MLHVATCLWQANQRTLRNSGTYTEEWVEKLYRGFRRNLTVPFRFVCFCDYPRRFNEPINQMALTSKRIDYGSFTEPYKLNEPMILVGLDTVIVGNIDHLAEWCLTGDRVALPRDPKSVRLKAEGYPDQSINGVALVPKGWRRIYDEWDGVTNDMVHLRKYPWECMDDRWPGAAVSYKLAVRPNDNRVPDGARIVYFHGAPKMNSLLGLDWVRNGWT